LMGFGRSWKQRGGLKAQGVKRGDWAIFPGGVRGRYVGTTPAGVEWVAHDDVQFERMVRRFDDMVVRRVKLSSGSYEIIADLLTLYEGGIPFNFRRTYIEGRGRDIADLAMRVEEEAENAGEAAASHVHSDNPAQQEFAYRSAYVAHKILAERLRGKRIGRMARKRMWREVPT